MRRLSFLFALLLGGVFMVTPLSAGEEGQKASSGKKGIAQGSVKHISIPKSLPLKRRDPIRIYQLILLEELCFDSVEDDNDYRINDLRMTSFVVNNYALGSSWPGAAVVYGHYGCEVLFQKATSNCRGGLIAYADPADNPRAAQICDTLSDVFTSSKNFLVDTQGFVSHLYNVDGILHPIMNMDGIRIREAP